MWSGPRSLSTATMYSFSQRPDTLVLDEPLYAHYLNQNPHLSRPYKTELLQAQDIDGTKVIQNFDQILANSGKKILFVKHMAKQVENIDVKLLAKDNCRHIFLIRDPFAMIQSWGVKHEKHQEGCHLEATSLPRMVQLFSDLRRRIASSVGTGEGSGGRMPVVLDSDILKHHPRQALMQLCHELGVPFFEEQLSWVAGPKPFDG